MELSTKMDQALVNVANKLSMNYSMKQESLTFAKMKIDRSLKIISDIFEEFQQDYLYLLEDHQRLQLLIEKNGSKENQRFSKPNLSITEEKIDQNKTVMEFETPGIVENTQLEVQSSRLKKKQLAKKQNSSTSPKKNSCNNENRMPKLNISKFSPIKSQLGISKSSVDIHISSSGKISRQSKLIVTPVEVKTVLTVPNKLESYETEEKNEVGQVDELNIDLTMFEVPFSQENVPEVVNKSQKDLQKMKKLLCLSSKSSKSSLSPNKTDLKVIKQPNNDTSKLPLKKSLKKTDKKTQSGSMNLFVPAKPTVNLNESPILANESQFFSLSDKEKSPVIKNLNKCDEKNVTDFQETFFHTDETYCSAGEIVSPNVKNQTNIENDVNVNKRKLDVAGPSNIPVVDLASIPEDFGNVSDWDTDMSGDKWTTPPKKRNLLDSFDQVPEKKKKSPTYAYKGPTVRQKAQRAKLQGWDCSDCEKYYNNLGLPQEEIKKRQNQCSRHRSKFNERYLTPPGFWNPNFPDIVSSEEEMEH